MNKELKTKVLLGKDDLILRTRMKSDQYWTTRYNLEEFGPIREMELNTIWMNSDEKKNFFSS